MLRVLRGRLVVQWRDFDKLTRRRPEALVEAEEQQGVHDSSRWRPIRPPQAQLDEDNQKKQ
jgi:hypothetical protein